MKTFTDPYGVVKYPLSTEKSLRLMESENKLVFVVDMHATKKQIAKAVEELFKVKIKHVTTHRMIDGTKRAYVTFSQETPAIDVATNLGMM
jgi:ribosomal protein uL23